MWEFHPIADVREFLEVGGGVLVLITGAIVVMWTLLFERLWFFVRIHRGSRAGTGDSRDRLAARELRILRQRLERRIPIIRAVIAVCPLMGLLGTVLGMIEVFEVTALSGSSNVRAIAAGVSKATITTMAGLVAALSGMVLLAGLDRFVREARSHAERQHLLVE